MNTVFFAQPWMRWWKMCWTIWPIKGLMCWQLIAVLLTIAINGWRNMTDNWELFLFIKMLRFEPIVKPTKGAVGTSKNDITTDCQMLSSRVLNHQCNGPTATHYTTLARHCHEQRAIFLLVFGANSTPSCQSVYNPKATPGTLLGTGKAPPDKNGPGCLSFQFQRYLVKGWWLLMVYGASWTIFYCKCG